MTGPSAGITRIRPRHGWEGLALRELWAHRELLASLTLRDIRVRYKQTFLGAGWAVLQPVIQMVVFTVFFGGLLRVPSDDFPYAVFSLAALVPWTFFSASLGGVAGSLVGNSPLLTKVYFPRLIVPLANVLGRLVDFAIALAVVFVLMLVYQVPVTAALLTLPLFLLLTIACALGVGLILAALNVYYRDVQVLVPFVLSLWQMASPVVYSSSLIEGPWRWIYSLNPMAGVIDGFRYALLGAEAPGPGLWVSVAAIALLLAVGLLIFQRTQRNMADIV